MLKYILLFSIVTASLLSACKKSLSNGEAAFDVQINATDLKAGDTATFSFSGSPDIITFYSGEVGKRYEYRNRTSADGIPMLRFRTIRANGAQANSLAVMVADNFEGVLVKDTPATVSRISSAVWTDITSRATLSTGGAAAVASGQIDLTDLSARGKPVYIAFRYQGFTGSAQSKWTIDSFSVKNVLADGTSYEIANMNAGNISYTNYGVPTFSPGFSAFRVTNSYYWVVNSTSLVITGATSAGAAASAEAWVILGPIDLKKVTPDIGLQVKNVSQRTEDLKLIYKYATAGTYNLVFSGGKISREEEQYTTKSFQITVK
jgi:hypothetical protein